MSAVPITHRTAGSGFSFFWALLALIAGTYLLFIVSLLVATATYASPGDLVKAMESREIQFSVVLSLLTCSVTALLSLLIAVPAGYLLARSNFWGKTIAEAALDIPIVLPPMVIGLCLLIFFQTAVGHTIEKAIPFTYTVYGVVLAQLVIGAAFAIRTMRGTFDHLSSRPEDVAMTLGCSRGRAVWLVTFPAAWRGMLAAMSVAWARSLGEFGPILVFAGATRMKTEVLPTTVWLELSVGNLEAAVAVSMLMVAFAMVVLVAVRWAGERI
jgi:molybdate transport system permease protein